MSTITLKDGRTVEIEQDMYPDSPRTWDNLGTFYTFERRYASPDQHHYDSPTDLRVALADIDDTLNRIDDRYAHLAILLGEQYADDKLRAMKHEAIDNAIDAKYIMLNVYKYEHSGVIYRTSPFSDPWDSGQVGYIFVSKEAVRKEWKVKRITRKLRAQVEEVLSGEVDVYSQYANGEVYGIIVRDADGEEIDACWGFYGSDVRENGMLDNFYFDDDDRAAIIDGQWREVWHPA
jgi:hypothetical protein